MTRLPNPGDVGAPCGRWAMASARPSAWCSAAVDVAGAGSAAHAARLTLVVTSPVIVWATASG